MNVSNAVGKDDHDLFWKDIQNYSAAMEYFNAFVEQRKINKIVKTCATRFGSDVSPGKNPLTRAKGTECTSITDKSAPFQRQSERLTTLVLFMAETDGRIRLKDKRLDICDDYEGLFARIAGKPTLCAVELLRRGPEDVRRFTPSSYRNVGKLRELLQVLAYQLRDNRDDPIFPLDSPGYPSSYTIPFDYKGHTIHVKDEGGNPTGSHKDRWALEQLLTLLRTIGGEISEMKDDEDYPIPAPSMISAGSAALAYQCLLRKFDLPNLRVILDIDKDRIPESVEQVLRVNGARTYRKDLSTRSLSETDVKEITNNPNGHDITCRNAQAAADNKYYDWLTCEILSECPDHIFVPFGTGELFSSILYFLLDANETLKTDDRLKLVEPDVKNIGLYGATTSRPKTKMDKLYAAYRPSEEGLKDTIALCKSKGIIRPESGYKNLEDKWALEAEKWARNERLRIRTGPSGMAGMGLFIKSLENGNKFGIDPKEKVLVVNTGRFFNPLTA